MTDAIDALDHRIVDRIPETLADISAQLRLFRALGNEGTTNWADERDERLYKSMMAGIANLGGGGAGERSAAPSRWVFAGPMGFESELR